MQTCWRQYAAIAAFSLVAVSSVQAADWVPVIEIGGHVREIDTSSIAGKPPVFTYATRHVFGDLDEYRIGRRGIKYLVIQGKADCSRQTTSRMSVDAYDENMSLVSKQAIQNPDEVTATPESIDEAVLKFVCKPK